MARETCMNSLTYSFSSCLWCWNRRFCCSVYSIDYKLESCICQHYFSSPLRFFPLPRSPSIIYLCTFVYFPSPSDLSRFFPVSCYVLVILSMFVLVVVFGTPLCLFMFVCLFRECLLCLVDGGLSEGVARCGALWGQGCG